ncbi:DUF1707 SHOCT-like domain-containing protein [Microlunatus flavus]|uniref:DUF1707 domain-containing protein n=1 Tax=Microlunatus flavus TaxID=1036181 RepID=A0A1H9LPN0_9ACTN|nr:DUF1707 domain-containing protein [Microlunatus flavus]SER13115.1 protein of unknown function [Microlunatus flavus]
MSELPISSPYRSRPDAPVTDTEREQLNARLNQAYTDGRLDADDYQARLDTLFGAITLGQLVPVVDGLPPAATYDSPALVPSGGGAPGELSPARDARGVSLGVVVGVTGVVVVLAILFLVLFGLV